MACGSMITHQSTVESSGWLLVRQGLLFRCLMIALMVWCGRPPQARVVCQSKSGQRRRVVGSYDTATRHVLQEPSGDWLTLAEFAYKVRALPAWLFLVCMHASSGFCQMPAGLPGGCIHA